MSVFERVALWLGLIVVIVVSLSLGIGLVDMQRQMALFEQSLREHQAEAGSEIAAVQNSYSYLEGELVRTQSELSIETSNLKASLNEEAAKLRAETAGLKETTESLESSLSEETQARIDSGQTFLDQITSIQDSSDVEIDIARLLGSVVLVACEVSEGNFSQGSGTFIDGAGRLITNAHVVDPNEDYTIGDERLCVIGVTDSELNPPVYKYTADIITLNRSDDMSTLKVDGGVNGHSAPDSFVYLPYPSCATKQPTLNDEVFIVGYPIIGQSTFTITNGIVSGFLDGDIKTSAKIDEGNSGGAAVNALGEFIGIPTYSVAGELDSLAYVIDLRKRTCQ